MSDPVGGQALIDGVMIRRGDAWAAAARRSDGSVAVARRVHRLALPRLRGVPVLRGMGALVDSLRIGMTAMSWSREQGVAGGDGEAGSAGDGPRERVVVIGIVSLVLAGFLLLPVAVAVAVQPVVGGGIGSAVVEGLVRLALFVAYLAMLSRLEGVVSTLEYHGAEHMVVAAYESGDSSSIVAIREHSVRHPRCGTDFFLLIFVVSIVVFSLVGDLPLVWLVATRVLLAPLVVGISYEILRAGGDHHNPLSRLLARPGLALQRFTTREPRDDQIEVAMAALEALLEPPDYSRTDRLSAKSSEGSQNQPRNDRPA